MTISTRIDPAYIARHDAERATADFLRDRQWNIGQVITSDFYGYKITCLVCGVTWRWEQTVEMQSHLLQDEKCPMPDCVNGPPGPKAEEASMWETLLRRLC